MSTPSCFKSLAQGGLRVCPAQQSKQPLSTLLELAFFFAKDDADQGSE
jgi:hypothetical protein